MNVGDEVDEVAGQENENGVCAGIEWAYQGVVDCRTSGGVMKCLVGQLIEIKSTGGHTPAVVVVVSWSVCP
jgi:hypothetical protein